MSIVSLLQDIRVKWTNFYLQWHIKDQIWIILKPFFRFCLKKQLFENSIKNFLYKMQSNKKYIYYFSFLNVIYFCIYKYKTVFTKIATISLYKMHWKIFTGKGFLINGLYKISPSKSWIIQKLHCIFIVPFINIVPQ